MKRAPVSPKSDDFDHDGAARRLTCGGKPRLAELAGEWMSRTGQRLENVDASDRVIFLKPGETILGHTNEFIGGRKTVTTMMKARSSMGRNFIEVCKCAGW